MEDYESLLCMKNEVFVYQIPARQSNRGYRAADWKLDEPDWTGRLKVTSKGRNLVIKLEDRTSGELFAKCPVEGYPSPVIEQVLDSSRYFVIRIQDDSGRHAFIGLGFADRGDSFDLLVAIQDHFKQVKRDEKQEIEVANQSSDPTLSSGPKLDLGFKEGQTIKLNITTKKNEATGGVAKSRPKGAQAGAILLPPPPGSSGPKLSGPPAPAGARAAPLVSPPDSSYNPLQTSVPQPARSTAAPASNVDLLLDLGTPLAPANNPRTAQDTTSEWDEFTSAVSSKLTIQQKPAATLPAQKSGPNAASWENFE